MTKRLSAVDVLLTAVVLAVPVLVLPSCRDRFMAPKESLFEIITWIALCGAAWHGLLHGTWRQLPAQLPRQPLFWPLVAVLVSGVLSLALRCVPFVPHRGVLLGLFSILFVLLAAERMGRQPALRSWLAHAYLAALAIMAVVALWQDWFPDPRALTGIGASLAGVKPDWRFGVFSTAGNPNFVASALIVGLPVAAAGALFARRLRTVYLALSALLLAALLSVFSVGGMTGAAVALLALMAWAAWHRAQLRRALALGAVLAVVLAWYLLPNPWNARGESYLSAARQSARWSTAWQPRVFIWKTTSLMILDRPLLGVGWGGFFHEQQLYQGEHYRRRGTPHPLPRVGLVNYAHQLALQTAAERGLVGLLAGLWLVGIGALLLVRLARSDAGADDAWLRVACGLGLLAALVQGLSDDPMVAPPGRIGMLAWAAILLAAPAPRRGPREERPGVMRLALVTLLCAAPALAGGLHFSRLVLGEQALAALDFPAVVHYIPQEPLGHQGYAGWYATKFEFGQALGQMKLAYFYLPDVRFATGWAMVAQRMHAPGEMVAAWRAYLAVNPCYGPAWQRLAEALRAAREPEAAQEAEQNAARFTTPETEPLGPMRLP